MQCSQCQFENIRQAKFCNNCGYKLSAGEIAIQPAVQGSNLKRAVIEVFNFGLLMAGCVISNAYIKGLPSDPIMITAEAAGGAFGAWIIGCLCSLFAKPENRFQVRVGGSICALFLSILGSIR